MTTNLRPTKCLDCLRSIPAGRGTPAGSRYLCPSCVETRKSQDDADRYRRQIENQVSSVTDRWLVRGDLSRLIGHLGVFSSLVLQAVADRVEDTPASYKQVMAIAREERAMLGV